MKTIIRIKDWACEADLVKMIEYYEEDASDSESTAYEKVLDIYVGEKMERRYVNEVSRKEFEQFYRDWIAAKGDMRSNIDELSSGIHDSILKHVGNLK